MGRKRTAHGASRGNEGNHKMENVTGRRPTARTSPRRAAWGDVGCRLPPLPGLAAMVLVVCTALSSAPPASAAAAPAEGPPAPAAAQPAPSPPPAKPGAARVVIVTGQEHPAHNWRATAPALAEILRKDLRLDVRVVEDPQFLASPELAGHDAIVLHFMNHQQPAPGAKARENLRRFVEGGKGLVLVHFACGAFQDWPEFRSLVGRVWDPKLRGHDPRGPFRVEIASPKHPITEGLQAFDADDELYTCLAGEAPVTVLATARSKVDGKDYPMAFVYASGKGRVFQCLLGHDVKALAVPTAGELYRRGAAWAAGLAPVAPDAR